VQDASARIDASEAMTEELLKDLNLNALKDVVK
jgi:hypothetical protein